MSMSSPWAIAALLRGGAGIAQGFSEERQLRDQANRQMAQTDYKTRLGMIEQSYEQTLAENANTRKLEAHRLSPEGQQEARLNEARITTEQKQGEYYGSLGEKLRAEAEGAEKAAKEAKAAQQKAEKEEKERAAQEAKAQKELDKIRGLEHSVDAIFGEAQAGRRDAKEVLDFGLSHPEVLPRAQARYKTLLGAPDPADSLAVGAVPQFNVKLGAPAEGVPAAGATAPVPAAPPSPAPAPVPGVGAVPAMPTDMELMGYVGKKVNPTTGRPFQTLQEVKSYLSSQGM